MVRSEGKARRHSGQQENGRGQLELSSVEAHRCNCTKAIMTEGYANILVLFWVYNLESLERRGLS